MPDHAFPAFGKWASHPLALVHTDLIGPMPMEPYSHARCYKHILFPLFFPTFSHLLLYTYAYDLDLVIFIIQQLSYHTDIPLSFPFLLHD